MNRIALSVGAASASLLALAGPVRADFADCVASLRADGARAGISQATLDTAFRGLTPDMKVLDFQKEQPEFKTPIWDYVAGLVDDQRVADGKAAMAREARALARAEETYGVSRYMLAAIWGVESNFGAEMGKRPLVQSLSTLACFGERAGYFRSELMATLKIIDRGDVPADKLAGSWAGAFGQTQFMPSTFLRLAVDFQGDGRRDIVDFGARRAGVHSELSEEVRLAHGTRLGLRSEVAAGIFRPLGAQGEAVDVVLGGARVDPHRRARAWRGRCGAAPAGGPGRPGVPRDAQFRRRLLL